MTNNIKKVLDKREGIQDFTKGKVEKYIPENAVLDIIDEIDFLLEFLEDDYSKKCTRLKELRDHLAEMFLE